MVNIMKSFRMIHHFVTKLLFQSRNLLQVMASNLRNTFSNAFYGTRRSTLPRIQVTLATFLNAFYRTQSSKDSRNFELRVLIRWRENLFNFRILVSFKCLTRATLNDSYQIRCQKKSSRLQNAVLMLGTSAQKQTTPPAESQKEEL